MNYEICVHHGIPGRQGEGGWNSQFEKSSLRAESVPVPVPVPDVRRQLQRQRQETGTAICRPLQGLSFCMWSLLRGSRPGYEYAAPPALKSWIAIAIGIAIAIDGFQSGFSFDTDSDTHSGSDADSARCPKIRNPKKPTVTSPLSSGDTRVRR